MKLEQKLLGIDYGDKKIGLSVSANSLALPLAVLENNVEFSTKLQQLIASEKISKLIVGLPLGSLGEETDASEKVREFVRRLRTTIQIEVDYYDERLTTAQVKSLKIRGEDDAHAAAILLQSYLDRNVHNV